MCPAIRRACRRLCSLSLYKEMSYLCTWRPYLKHRITSTTLCLMSPTILRTDKSDISLFRGTITFINCRPIHFVLFHTVYICCISEIVSSYIAESKLAYACRTINLNPVVRNHNYGVRVSTNPCRIPRNRIDTWRCHYRVNHNRSRINRCLDDCARLTGCRCPLNRTNRIRLITSTRGTKMAA